MSIQQTKKQSDLEKRLSLLRKQVYGRESVKHSTHTTNYPLHTTNSSDVTYLYQDLSKIGILAGLALGFQITLFFLIKNHILNLKLF